eukprot:XP_001708120.1 Hypothetical protein GL50803_115424 [Giardia lamblia ATCC 50803]
MHAWPCAALVGGVDTIVSTLPVVNKEYQLVALDTLLGRHTVSMVAISPVVMTTEH